MFFLKSCSASVVCLVSTFLVVYISHCGSVPVISDNYLSTGLLPMINNIMKNPLSQMVGLEGLFKSNCSQNEVDPEKDLNSCIHTVIDFTATVGRLRKSPVEEFTGELNSVFKEFCVKRTTLQQCFQRSYQDSSHCWMDGIKKNWPRIIDLTNSVSTFACSEEGDRVAQFLATGGSQCLLAKEEDIRVCFNKTIAAHIPTYLYAKPERQLDEEDCNDIKTLQKCALKHLEMCETQSAAIFVNNTLNAIWSSNCSHPPAPVSEQAEMHGDLDEGGLLSFASGLISIVYVAAESVLKSAVGTLTSSNNTVEDTSLEPDTNDGLGSRDSNTPVESSREIHTVDEKDDFSISHTVEKNTTHDENLYDLNVEQSAEYFDLKDYEIDELLPISELETNGTDHDPTDASKADIIVNDKPSNVGKISGNGTYTTRMHVDFTTAVPPVDHASLLNHTTLLVISSYVVLSLVIIVLIITLFCENLLPQAVR